MSQDVQKLIAQAKDQTILIGVKRRRDAVRKLGEIGSPDVITALFEALQDEDNEVKKNAFLALSSITDPWAREEIRNLYLKTKDHTLWQIIRKNEMYPEDLGRKFSFFARLDMKEEILSQVNEDNFDDVLNRLMESNMDNPVQVLNIVIEKGGDKVAMGIVRKFIETNNDNLFQLIEKENWYPPDLNKKLMFLLKARRYEKVLSMLDGVDFRQVLNILIDPKFPMKKYAQEALSELKDPIIIDEICQIFISEDLPPLADLIIKNHWTPTGPKEKVFFYFKTPFLQDFFNERKIIIDMLGGYMTIPHIREKLEKEDYEKLAAFLKEIVAGIATEEMPLVPDNNPLDQIFQEARLYMETSKSDETIKEICADYLYSPNVFLGNLIKGMGWAPVDLDERIEFFLRSGQEEKVAQMKESAVMSLFHILKRESADEILKDKARKILSETKDPEVISRLFRLYFQTFDGEVDAIIKGNKWEPEKSADKALYFIFSGQPEKYVQVEKGGFTVLTEAYKSLITDQRYKLVEILINKKSEYFTNFLVSLFQSESSPRILGLLANIVKSYPDRVYKLLRSSIRKIDGSALEEIIKILYNIQTGSSLELLYYIARVKKGFTCLWILKLLEDARWQPENPSEKIFFYELFKSRDELARIQQNRLVDEDPEIRVQAAGSFADLKDEKLLNVLMKYVEDPDERVGSAIADTMGQLFALSPENSLEQFNSFHIGSTYMIFNEVRKAFMVSSEEERINILSRNYRSGQLILRHFCISALERLKNPMSIPTLELALKDQDMNIRLSALKTINEIAEPECQKSLYPLLEDENFQIRMLSAQALSKIADIDLLNRITKRLNLNEFIHCDAMIELLSLRESEKHREYFVRVIKRPDMEVTGKQNALVALARIGDQDAIQQLINYYNFLPVYDVSPNELLPLIKAFKIIGHSMVYKYLEKLLNTNNWQVRRAVIEAMAHIPDRTALVKIIKALEDYDGWVQMAALDSLTHYFNFNFKFQMTDKDLKFVGAIIARLKKFKLNAVQDKHLPQYQVLSQLNSSLMLNELIRLYAKFKDKIASAPQAE